MENEDNKNTRTITVRVPKKNHTKLVLLAHERYTSMNKLINRLIAEELMLAECQDDPDRRRVREVAAH